MSLRGIIMRYRNHTIIASSETVSSTLSGLAGTILGEGKDAP